MNNANSFELLGNLKEDSSVQIIQKGLPSSSGVGMSTLNRSSTQEHMNDLTAGNILKKLGKYSEDMDILQQEEVLDEIEYIDIGDLDLEGIEKYCPEKDKGYVPQEQVSLLKEAILKAKTSNSLGISLGSFK